MADRTMIRLAAGPRRFNFRVAGLGFRNGHVLVHRATHETFWTFPGGRAEIGETSEETLRREMAEELAVEVTVERLLWVAENFFDFEGSEWHELGLYYLMDIPPAFPFQPDVIVHRVRDGGSELEFKWVEATRSSLERLGILPLFLAEEISCLPQTVCHRIVREGNP